MCMQAVQSSKLSETFFALERFLPCVNPHMNFEIFFCIRGIRTSFTKPVFLILVNGFCMCLQIPDLVCNLTFLFHVPY